MKAYYVKYRTATGEHTCIVPACDAFGAITTLLHRAGLTFRDLKTIKSCSLRLA